MTTSSSALFEPLQPRLSFLRREEVLVQAWKKASAHIRYHNWFSDTLELDWTTVNLPDFLDELSSTLESSDRWRTDPIRIVPAPKSQPGWKATSEADWEPPDQAPWRPLAHVTLRDQVVATSIMLCLADRVETLQGDTRLDISSAENRKAVVSYGNRLFCDRDEQNDGTLRHRWGSAKLYRRYFKDYRTFLERPERVALEFIGDATESPAAPMARRPFIVCTDLSKFYDRVCSKQLTEALDALSEGPDERSFFAFASEMLKWRWNVSDQSEVERYEDENKLSHVGFSEEVSLPQGLVAAGFFANVVLLALDELVVAHFDQEIIPGVHLHDYCRYVDDIRLVVSTTETTNPDVLGSQVREWLQELVDETASDLTLSKKKTTTIGFGESAPRLIRIGATMDRIQTAVSGGFDAIEGERILDTVQSLIKSQPAAFADDDDSKWYLSPVPDVRDDTVARFCARRFRTTYRSLRPLLEGVGAIADGERGLIRSQTELDEQARSFAVSLIDRWVKDPSNIRVLRIGLDVWPHHDALEAVLELLRKHVWSDGPATDPMRTSWYCLSEVFRAGAAETGMVESAESLHGGIDIAKYRAVLYAEAKTVLSERKLPWYVRQQAFLFVAAIGRVGGLYGEVDDLPGHYGALVSFLAGDSSQDDHAAFATAAILVRRTLRGSEESVGLVLGRLYGRDPQEIGAKLSAIGLRDLSFLEEILRARGHLEAEVDPWLRFELGRWPKSEDEDRPAGKSLFGWVRDDTELGSLRNELALLRLARRFLEAWQATGQDMEVITPNQVYVDLSALPGNETKRDRAVTITESTVASEHSIYRPPSWCPAHERWRLQLGYLLRFILAGRPDYTRPIGTPTWREGKDMYRSPVSHWYLRRYGFFNAQQAFGNNWLPISDWMEDLLLALLRWPGCRPGRLASHVGKGIDHTVKEIGTRISWLEKLQGARTGLLVLPISFRRKTRRPSIHACVAQTVIPGTQDFESYPCDPTLSHTDIRSRHRSHLATTLRAVRTMVNARASHLDGRPRLDWLILPELAVHPMDIQTHLIPFARVYKALILTGVTYHELQAGGPLVNSALWIMPEYSPEHGLQTRIRWQGKQHLSPDERRFNVEGVRPCQWLIEYPCERANRDFRLTASVCYDATDLHLASDLRDKSDVFAIPALNKDVKTFDRMALALHYHMFQLVIVANNGGYGGSSAYWPKRDRHKRRIFHVHSQPQMSIAFLEIGTELLDRHSGDKDWKHPPAGLDFLAGKDGAGW